VLQAIPHSGEKIRLLISFGEKMKVHRYKKRRQENRSMKTWSLWLQTAVKVLSPSTFYSLREKAAQYPDSRTF